ncbi:MAG: hypothetical protein WBG42_04535 [Cryomorphaceae bacterium]
MRIKRPRIKERFLFLLERQFVKGAYYQLLFVAAAIGLISVVGGLLVMPVGEPTGSFNEAVWWAFLRLSDPGYLGDDEGTWRRFISTIVTVLGYVVFLGSLVAIITTWLNRKIRNLEQGLTPVAANNHVIILGWTNRTIHIAAEIFHSVGRLRRFLKLHGTRSLRLIILSDDVTPDHVQELKDNPLIGNRAHEIILRSGVAIDREHLKRVDSLNAAAIIIPSQANGQREFVTPDVETIKALLSLNAESENNMGRKRPFVVAEIQDENKISAAYRAYSGPIEVIGSNTIISRLLAQNIRHHGLSEVYNELLSRSLNNNLFAKEYPELNSKSIAEAKSYFPRAVIIGIIRVIEGGFKPMLNLRADFPLEKEDRLVILAKNQEAIEPSKKPEPILKVELKRPLPVDDQNDVTKVLILGWNHHIPSLIKEFSTYEDETYEIVMASLRPVESREKDLALIIEAAERITVKHVVVDYVKENELRTVNPGEFDNILLVSTDLIEDEEEADARTIVGYILLEEILDDVENRPQVLLELADPSNEILIKRFKSEVIIGPLILSHLLAAVALRRELQSLYRELLTVGGAEIIFREPSEYGLQNGEIKFQDLEALAEGFHETALGTYRVVNRDEGTIDLVMNPDRNTMLKINDSVSLVVITTVY